MTARSRTCLAALLAAVAVIVLPSFGAAAVTLPAGSPNLAQSVIQPADLAAGAGRGPQRYIKPPEGFTAEYASTLTGAGARDGTRYTQLRDFVALAPEPTLASDLYAGEQTQLASPLGRRRLIRELVLALGAKHGLRARDVRIGTAVTLGIGSGSFAETVRVRLSDVFIEETLIAFVDGDVYAGLALTGTLDEPLWMRDGRALANTLDAHIHAVLGTTGATGPTGSSGATGATDASGASGSSSASGSSGLTGSSGSTGASGATGTT